MAKYGDLYLSKDGLMTRAVALNIFFDDAKEMAESLNARTLTDEQKKEGYLYIAVERSE